MRYNVGDKVRVRSDLEGSQDYCGVYCTNGMAGLKGQIVTIANIDGNRYKIEEDDRFHWWSDDLFEVNIISEKIQELEEKIENLEYDKYVLKMEKNYLIGKVEAYENILAKMKGE